MTNRRTFLAASAGLLGCKNNQIIGRKIPLFETTKKTGSQTWRGFSQIVIDFHLDNPRIYVDLFGRDQLFADGVWDAAYEINFKQRKYRPIDVTPPFVPHYKLASNMESFENRYFLIYRPTGCSIFTQVRSETIGFRTALLRTNSDNLSVEMMPVRSIDQLTRAAQYLKH